LCAKVNVKRQLAILNFGVNVVSIKSVRSGLKKGHRKLNLVKEVSRAPVVYKDRKDVCVLVFVKAELRVSTSPPGAKDKQEI
jgi:hypothetical protein